jgi:transcriptional regulatory protein LevR
VIGTVDNVKDGLCIGIEESIHVRFVWHATCATERVAFAAAAYEFVVADAGLF